MGWCHEFGVEIEARCDHPMTAGASTCSCSECGTVCRGRFEGGCEEVWRRGPRKGAPRRRSRAVPVDQPVVASAPEPTPTAMPAPQASPSPPVTIQVLDSHETTSNGVSKSADPEPAVLTDEELPEPSSTRAIRIVVARLAERIAQQNKRLLLLDQQVADLTQALGRKGEEMDHRFRPPEPRINPPEYDLTMKNTSPRPKWWP